MKPFRFGLPFLAISLSFLTQVAAQNLNWAKSGSDFYLSEGGQIVKSSMPMNPYKPLMVSLAQLTPKGTKDPLKVKSFKFSDDEQKVLLFTSSVRVWRYETRGDYWLLDRKSNELKQIGKQRPPSTLMFAKLSPDKKWVAYVSERNIFVENVADGTVKQLTQSNSRKQINGTFDWVYEEEFDCRDGFRWSPDSKNIAYWQIDASQVKDFSMINNTEGIYPRIVPVEYPKVGELPSPFKIGVVNIENTQTSFISFDAPTENTYLPRMEWANNSEQLILQQLNRKQNESKLLYADIKTGKAKAFYEEKDAAWIDLKQEGVNGDGYFDWTVAGDAFYWISEKNGWRHLYRISRDGKKEECLTKVEGKDFDVIKVVRIDEIGNWLYFMASPDNATQSYLYKTQLVKKGKTTVEKITPENQIGSHDYAISPDGRFGRHMFTNHFTPQKTEWVSLKGYVIDQKAATPFTADPKPGNLKLEFFNVTTIDGTKMDGWIQKPTNFDPTKKYPILFYVYSEPAATNVLDDENAGGNAMYTGDLTADGYIYVSIDGRGTPLPRGRAWRKAIYRNIGTVNIRDQAMGALEVFKKYSFIDTNRVAVWGWSGGGSTTLNLLFQYPKIYKTGIAIAAVANQLTYDNIYQERYMGLPQENMEDFVKGSPITHAKSLQGNLLYIHGTGDDNVHYQNAEMLLNELIKHNKQFQFMAYPNRTHGIFEGEGTSRHLATLFTKFLKEKCPPGGR